MAFWSSSPCRDFGLGRLGVHPLLAGGEPLEGRGLFQPRQALRGHREVELQGAFHGEPPIAEVPVVEKADMLVILKRPIETGDLRALVLADLVPLVAQALAHLLEKAGAVHQLNLAPAAPLPCGW